MRRKGDLYKGPGAEWVTIQEKAVAEPGVLAGFSHMEKLPVLTGGYVQKVQTWYACAPLARRVDMDRVYRAMRANYYFHSVRPWGGVGKVDEARGVFKTAPWLHMNTFKVLAESGGGVRLIRDRRH